MVSHRRASVRMMWAYTDYNLKRGSLLPELHGGSIGQDSMKGGVLQGLHQTSKMAWRSMELSWRLSSL